MPKRSTNTVKLTEALVRDTKAPETGTLELRDTEVPGLVLRVAAGGKKTFGYKGRNPGGKGWVNRVFGPWPVLTVSEARKQAIALAAALLHGEDPHRKRKAQDVGRWTLEQLFQTWLREHGSPHLRPTTLREVRRIFAAYLKRPLGGKQVAEITPELVAAVIADVAENHGKTQSNRVLAWLRAFYGFAKRRYGYAAPPPTTGITRFRETPRQRVPTEQELATLLRWCKEHSPGAGDAIYLLLATGVRRSTLNGGSYDQVKAGIWHVPGTKMKAGRPHVLPLAKPVLAMLEWRVALKLPWPRVSEKKWREARATLGLADLRLHDLRRAAASSLLRLGCPTLTIAAYLGHAVQGPLAMSAIYAVPDLSELHRWAERLAEYYESLVANKGAEQHLQGGVASAR